MKVDVNGITLNYEVDGVGHPLILIHGNGESLEIFDELTIKLKKHYQVYRIDSRNHGQSSQTSQYGYQIMADDIYHFIRALNINKPYLFGFSDGGILGLMLAFSYPDLLSKLVIAGSNTRPKGMRYKVIKAMKRIYNESKNPLYHLMLSQPFIKKRELREIKVPVLILVGSKDLIIEHHTLMIHRQIRTSKINIMNNRRHDDYIVHKDELYEPLLSFFES